VTGSAPRVLFVCTANIVRSPIAAALLRMRLQETGTDVIIQSAGLRDAGPRIDNGAVEALQRFGVDVRHHRSRRLDAESVRQATLILGLEREHVREVVLLDTSAWPRTFTLKEIVRRGEVEGIRQRDESIEQWIARAHAGRTRQELLGADPIDDVADPYGGAPGDYWDAAERIDELVAHLVRLAWSEHTLA
jgi:protein-tyrosine phosphatase